MSSRLGLFDGCEDVFNEGSALGFKVGCLVGSLVCAVVGLAVPGCLVGSLDFGGVGLAVLGCFVGSLDFGGVGLAVLGCWVGAFDCTGVGSQILSLLFVGFDSGHVVSSSTQQKMPLPPCESLQHFFPLGQPPSPPHRPSSAGPGPHDAGVGWHLSPPFLLQQYSLGNATQVDQLPPLLSS